MDLGEGVFSLGAKSQKVSSKKVSKKSPGAGFQKSENSLEKGPKSRQKSRKMGFGGLFDFWDPAPGDFFETFLETFWLLTPRLPLPGPRNLKSSLFLVCLLSLSESVAIVSCLVLSFPCKATDCPSMV